MKKNGSNKRFQIPYYRAQSGGKLTQQFVDEFISDLKYQGQRKQPQVFIKIILLFISSYFIYSYIFELEKHFIV
jgi:hypothetical protein